MISKIILRQRLLRVVPADGLPEEQAAQGLAVEGDEGIEVALPHHGFCRCQQCQDADNAQNEAPHVKGRRHQ